MQQRLGTTLLTALLFGLGSAATAQTGAKAGEMTNAQVTAKLEAAGYSNVHDVEREGTHFDADATKGGQPVHLHIDAKTGNITPVAKESEDEEKEGHNQP